MKLNKAKQIISFYNLYIIVILLLTINTYDLTAQSPKNLLQEKFTTISKN